MTNLVFVFGSNLRGVHGAGAAKEAVLNWGAIYSQGIGFQGKSYAIPSKDYYIKSLTLDEIADHVDTFIRYANVNPEATFLLTKIGCGLAGFTPEDIAPLFKKAVPLENIFFPYDFLEPLGLDKTRMSFDSKDKLAKPFR